MIESDGYQRDSYATDGAPAAADQEDELAEMLTPGRACRDYVSDFVERFADAYRGEMEHFVRAVRGGEEPRPSGTDAAKTFLKTAEQTLDVARELGCPCLVVHPAELVEGKAAKPMFRVSGEMWLTALRALERLAELGERAGVVYCLENLNTVVDHPGVPLARAKDTLALVEAVDSPHVRMMLDLYHAQIGEGNLVALIERAGQAIGEVQLADVPGRCEPGTGEIYYPAVARALQRIGYTGTVGLEAYASGDNVQALERFRASFTLEPLGHDD